MGMEQPQRDIFNSSTVLANANWHKHVWLEKEVQNHTMVLKAIHSFLRNKKLLVTGKTTMFFFFFFTKSKHSSKVRGCCFGSLLLRVELKRGSLKQDRKQNGAHYLLAIVYGANPSNWHHRIRSLGFCSQNPLATGTSPNAALECGHCIKSDESLCR